VAFLKPCSSCLRKRQRVKDALRALSLKAKSPRSHVETEKGIIQIDNKTRKIDFIVQGNFQDLVGLETYIAGKHVYDLENAIPIHRLGRIVKVSDLA
jgi:hypothetical protein